MDIAHQVPGFAPSRNGLHFGNSWPPGPVLTVGTPFGRLSLGDASKGVCGGMVYAVRDFFDHRLPIPADETSPAAGTPLYDYIVRRLWQSFDVPRGVVGYLAWQRRAALVQYLDTVTGQWPDIRRMLDADTLVPLGVLRVQASSWPGNLGHNHQVLAYGYRIDDSGVVSISVYDPNHHDHDDVTLSFGTRVGAPAIAVAAETGIAGEAETEMAGRPRVPSRLQYAVGGSTAAPETTYGVFVTRYSPSAPPDLSAGKE